MSFISFSIILYRLFNKEIIITVIKVTNVLRNVPLSTQYEIAGNILYKTITTIYWVESKAINLSNLLSLVKSNIFPKDRANKQ
ncbi:hypothetical protein [Rickettsia honei]|uniref:hypothetical protein n=1 Tax=Rickettsia honei TaxID=37816 RepID=UPI00036E712B|nr:hypothetical protein [Rickettsia honei]